jgi:hypothetical protein
MDARRIICKVYPQLTGMEIQELGRCAFGTMYRVGGRYTVTINEKTGNVVL